MNLARKMHCLEADLCDEIIQVLEESKYHDSTVIRKDGMKVEQIRTSTSTSLNRYHESIVHNALNASLLEWSKQISKEYPEVAACLKLPGVTPGLDTERESFSVLRYKDEQKYGWHTDAPIVEQRTSEYDASRRLISCVLYLNHNFVGGETEMLGRKYLPEKGKVLIFPSNWNYPHRACPVTEGTKYAVVTWYHPSTH